MSLAPPPERRTIPPTAIADQQRAADPKTSVWVSANAGAGKTTVLTSRVVRLLLAGARPESILCVTFTRVAAANMQDRVFRTLGDWVALDDAALTAALTRIEGRPPVPGRLAAARRLFARAVETPGGLRIQTIHGLAERILQQFPFEAGVPAGFSVIEPDQQEAMIADAIVAVTTAALAGGDRALAAALAIVSDEITDGGFQDLVRAWLPVVEAEAAPELKFARSPVRAALDVAPADTVAAVEAAMLAGAIPDGALKAAADALLAAGGVRNAELAQTIGQVIGTSDPALRLPLYLSVFLNKEMMPRSRKGQFITGAPRKADAAFVQSMDTEQERVAGLVIRRTAVAVASRTEAIERLAIAVLTHYRAAKRRRGLLDFFDLIARVAALLDDEAARWVQFKLDGGIDHVLVDEAQDTSPDQWRIIRALTAEFFAGAGARSADPQGLARTVFAVGDEKQSIFSFQGAAPQAFAESRRALQRAASGADAPFAVQPLAVSFRTVPVVLKAVDAVFAAEELRRKVVSDPADYRDHEPVRIVPPIAHPAPGLVELWPPIVAEKSEVANAFAPLDAPAENAPPVRLARRIARRIRLWLDRGERLADTGQRIGPGDVLILVQRRDAFFEAMLKALKRAAVPVAGADRMRLAHQLAVQDLLALIEVMLLPEDDLTLAAVLKSPLIGLDDDDLFALRQAAPTSSLWAALGRSGVPAHGQAAATFARWQKLAQTVDPLGFLMQVLGPEGGRRALLARLGPDAAEAIDGLLARVRAWLQSHPASLVGLVAALKATDAEIKREMPEEGGAVRIMTVHGAKGLEAPIVFLADTFRSPKPPGGGGPLPLRSANAGPGPHVWVRSGEKIVPALAEAAAGRDAADAAEHARLLYVAMTRARDRLIVAGYHGLRAPPAEAWHPMIAAALAAGVSHAGATVTAVSEPAEDGEGHVTVLRLPSAPAAPDRELSAAPPPAPSPDWLTRPAPAAPARQPPLRPSRLLASEPAPAEPPVSAVAAARLAGVLTHALLQQLGDVPAESRRAVGARLAALRAPALDASARDAALDAVLAVLDAPATAALFGPGSRAEVDLAGTLTTADGPRPVAGRIDRLAITADRVLIADFKTGRAPPAGAPPPDPIVAQLAAYRHVLADLHPAKTVTALVVWTALPRVDVIPPEALDAALRRFTQL